MWSILNYLNSKLVVLVSIQLKEGQRLVQRKIWRQSSNVLFKNLTDKLTPLDNLDAVENLLKDKLIENKNNIEIDQFENLNNEILGINENELSKMYEKNKSNPNQIIEETSDIIKNKEIFELDIKEEV